MKYNPTTVPVFLVACISVIALLGWWIDHQMLSRWIPGIANMTFNTAFCFLLLAIACMMARRDDRALFSIGFPLAVMLFAVLSLMEDLFATDFGIDNLMYDAVGLVQSNHPGRMSPNTAIAFLLASMGSMALAQWDRCRSHATIVHVILLLLTLFGVIGIGINLFLVDTPEGYAHFASISPMTALSFLLLAFTLMAELHARIGKENESTWLYSIVQMMYYLKYPQKFTLISMILLVPLMTMFWEDIEEANQRVQQAKLSLKGVAYVRLTDKLLTAVPEHRGMSNAGINATLFEKELHETMVTVDRLLAENTLLVKMPDQKIDIADDLEAITTRWEQIKYGHHNQQTLWRLHTEIINILLQRLHAIGEVTGLSREQDPILHMLLDVQLVALPALREYVGKLRGMGVSQLAGQSPTMVDVIKIGGVIGQIQLQINDINGMLQQPLQQQRFQQMRQLHQTYIDQLQGLLATAQKQFSSGQPASMSATRYFNLATHAIGKGALFNDAIFQRVDQDLQQRIRKQMTIQYNIKLAILVSILLLLILFIAFYQSVTYTIAALESSAKMMHDGKMDGLVHLPARDELGGVVRAFNSIAANLMEANLRVGAVVEHAVLAIVIIDRSGVIQTFNPAAEVMFGYSKEAVIGSNVMVLMPERYRQQHQLALEKFVATGKGVRDDHEIHLSAVRNGGEEFPMQMTIAPMKLAGEPSFVGMLRDVSEHEKLEASLRQAQKMEAVGTLVGGVAHNFNNILAGMMGTAYLAKKQAKNTPKAVKHLERLEESIDDAGAMIQQLLTFAQKDFMRDQREVLLATVVQDGVDAIRDKLPDDVALAVMIEPSEMHVYCDAAQISKVLQEIIANGSDAVAACSNKAIHVRLTRMVLDASFLKEHAELKRADSYGQLMIHDNGCGIESALFTRIFEPFYTTKEVGMGEGLGLSSAYGVIATHQGMMTVESEVGIGSTFTIYLPLLD
ncbi:MAG: PAS domain S-box protein [Mariprofundales bacterium]